VVIELLHDFQGAVQTDGYDVYSIYENKKGVCKWQITMYIFSQLTMYNN